MLALRDNGLPGSLGYPQNLRRAALANGRLDGAKRSEGDFCDDALQLDMFLRHTPNFLRRRMFFLGLNVTNAFSRANIYFTPAPNDRCRVFLGSINIFGSMYSGYTVPLWRRAFVRTGPDGGYDLAPGGSYNTQEQLRQKVEEGDDLAVYDAVFRRVVPEHDFIPTVSALGFQYRTMSSYQNTNSLPNPYTNLLVRGLVCNDETPFDDYYGPAHENTFHVQPDAAGLGFLLRELAPQTPPPVFAQSSGNICPDGGSATFAVKPVCSRRSAAGQELFPTTYTWTAGPGLRIRTQNNEVVEIESVTGSSVPATSFVKVVATRAGAGPSEEVVLPVTINYGYVRVAGGNNSVCFFTSVLFTAEATNTTGSTSWDVFLNNQLRNDLIEYATDTKMSVRPDQVGQLQVVATASDACRPGQTTAGYGYATVVGQIGSNPCVMQRPGVTMYPNPADGQVELTTNEASTAQRGTGAGTPPPAEFEATLYDGQGRPLQNGRSTQGHLRWNTRSLQPGLYHVQVRQSGRVSSLSLSIQR